MKKIIPSSRLPQMLITIGALLMVPNYSEAASVSFSTYTATSDTDTSWVFANADLSANFGSTNSASFGGVTFLGMRAGLAVVDDDDSSLLAAHLKHNVGFAFSANGFFTHGTAPALLNEGTYQGDSEYFVRFDNLTEGQQYKANFILADTRGDLSKTIDIQTTGTDTGSSGAAEFAFGEADTRFAVVTATWTADATVMDFRSLNSAGGTQINGVQLMAVPEPATSTALASAILLSLFRRRRS